jgi:RecJ-like exonuclease
LEKVKSLAEEFVKASEEKNIKVISHCDADGICSASIFIKMLLNMKKNFEVRIVKQLTKEVIDDISSNLKDRLLVLLDCGSGQINFLKNILEETKILILDHHLSINLEHVNLLHVNPTLYGISGISASMVTYLFAKSIDEKNKESIDLAIVSEEFDENDENAKKIVEEAEKLGKVKVERGIKLYGRYSRPIHKALEFSFDPFIPGISGSESNAIQFLSELGIKIKDGDKWRKLSDLSLEEQKKLASAIIIERLRWKEENATSIFGNNYTLLERPIEIRDSKELATLINACGKMERYDIGIRICLGDTEAIRVGLSILEEYRKLFAQYLELIRDGEIVMKTENSTYILGEGKIKDTFIGSLLSILLNSNLVEKNKPIFGFAESNGKVKVSARADDKLNINLRDIIALATSKVGGEGGGHKFAAGGLIPKSEINNFIDIVENELKKYGNQKA